MSVGHRPTILLYNLQFPRAGGCILSSEHVERRLAAILAADVAGSCRLIGIDEEGTLARLKALRRTIFDPKIAEHHGRVVKNTGDGAIAEFASVVDAVRCADEIQRGMAEQNIDVPQDKRIELRIGIHVGDIIIEENDIFGDGVNIAVRLEGIAEPGGISISEDARRQIRGKIDITFEDLGSQSLKNIAEPMRVWRVPNGRAVPPVQNRLRVDDAEPLALPDKPSIAVLPFQNMSDDPGQEHFTDGIVEEIITGLSRMRWLSVTARNSSFVYKGHSVNVKQVGRELGVRYVLEGSVRKAANRVRITAQLIDAATGTHLWADRFDGGLEDIFELQDQVTASVVGAIAPKLEQAEIERAQRKPTESLDAYDYYLRAHASIHPWTREGNEEALRLFYRAIELDPGFASAYGMAAWCWFQRQASGWSADRAHETAETERRARRAAELGKDDAVALSAAGFVLAYVVHDMAAGVPFTDRAVALNPNLAWAWLYSGWARIWLGQPDAAIEHLAHAMRLSPLDPLIADVQGATPPALYIAAAGNALAGHGEEASKAVTRLRQLDPSLSISNLREVLGPYRPEDLAKYEAGLRKAGLPE